MAKLSSRRRTCQQAQHLPAGAAPGTYSRRPASSIRAAIRRPNQPAQGRELGRQVPFHQRRRLIEGVDLPLGQQKVVDRIEDHVLPAVAARMARDDIAAAADHDHIDIAADPDVAMAVGDRDRVVVGLVAHQRLGAGPPRGLIAGVERRRWRFGQHGQIPREAFSDGFGVAPQNVRPTLAALVLQVGVERVPARKPWDRHHEVAAGIPDQPLGGALVPPRPCRCPCPGVRSGRGTGRARETR